MLHHFEIRRQHRYLCPNEVVNDLKNKKDFRKHQVQLLRARAGTATATHPLKHPKPLTQLGAPHLDATRWMVWNPYMFTRIKWRSQAQHHRFYVSSIGLWWLWCLNSKRSSSAYTRRAANEDLVPVKFHWHTLALMEHFSATGSKTYQHKNIPINSLGWRLVVGITHIGHAQHVHTMGVQPAQSVQWGCITRPGFWPQPARKDPNWNMWKSEMWKGKDMKMWNRTSFFLKNPSHMPGKMEPASANGRQKTGSARRDNPLRKNISPKSISAMHMVLSKNLEHTMIWQKFSLREHLSSLCVIQYKCKYKYTYIWI